MPMPIPMPKGQSSMNSEELRIAQLPHIKVKSGLQR
jgi:hypothetical protein